MKDIRFLATIVIGVVLIAAVYAFSAGDRRSTISVDSDEGRVVRHTVSGDRGEFVLRDDDREIKAEWKGEFTLDDAGADISSLENRFELSVEQEGVNERAEYRMDDGAVRREYYVDGEEQEAGDETREKLAALFLRFLRASGIKAKQRVAVILDHGGSPAVLDEIDLIEGDHATSRYAIAFVKQADLEPAELERLAEKLKTIESDHDLSHALKVILTEEDFASETAPALIDAAKTIESDHDLRQLVEALSEKPLNDESLDLALELFERIEGDHDLRVAATAFLENEALKPPQAAKLLRAAGDQVESDHDLRLVLIEAAPFYAGDEEARDAWRAAYEELSSSHDMRLALEEIAEGEGLGADELRALIEAAEAIDSSHDRRLTLERIATHIDEDANLRDAYRDAANRIESEHEREKALEAIGEE